MADFAAGAKHISPPPPVWCGKRENAVNIKISIKIFSHIIIYRNNIRQNGKIL